MIIELNGHKCTNLEVQIDTVSKTHFIDIYILDGKEVHVGKFLVCLVEVFAKTTISLFNLPLNADILHDVHDDWSGLVLTQPVHVRSVQGMTHLMSHQHVIDSVACLFPHGKNQDTSIDIELCSLYVLMLNSDVLSGKQTGESAFDFKLDRHWFVPNDHIIQKNPAFGARSCDAS